MHAAPGVAALLAVALAAQDRAPLDALQTKTALASDQPQAVAWGAHYARDKQFVRPLLDALTQWRSSTDNDARFVCLLLLDALLTLDARVPAADLVPLVDDATCGTWAFVLLAREPQHNESELLTLFRRDWPQFDASLAAARDLRTLAIGNLLAHQRTPGFAKLLLLVDLDLDLHIAAADDAKGEPEAREMLVRRLRFVAADGARVPEAPRVFPKGWPKRPSLALEPPSRRGSDEVRVPSALQIRAVRGTTWRDVEPVMLAPGHREPARALQWLGTVTGLAVPSVPQRLPLTDAKTFVDQVTRAREQQQTFVDAVRRELVDRLAATEKDVGPLARRISVQLTDERKDQTKPLPAIPPAR